MNAVTPPVTPPTIPPIASATPRPADLPALAKPSTAAVFRVMFWKEARELAPWAALAAIALSIALYQEAHRPLGSLNDWQGFSIISDRFNLVTAFIIPVIALLLGFLQFFGESKPDRFAFLVHRPTPRALMFLAKILPGIAVYLAVTLIPLAVAILWAKNPHHVPFPFQWAMALPALADVCAGLPYYFAGALVARRTDARWVGSRLLPVVAPLIASGINYAAFHFYWAILADLLATAILLAASRGAFLTGGQALPQPRPAKAALGLVLSTAICTLGTIAIGILISWLASNDTQSYRSTRIIFRADGTPTRLTTDQGQREYLADLSGKLITELTPPDRERSSLQLNMAPLSNGQQFWLSQRMPFRSPSLFFPFAFTVGYDIAWFRSAQGDYLAAYDLHNRALVGSIGPDGFAAGQSIPPTRFQTPIIPLRTRSVPMLAAGDTFYHVGNDYRLTPFLTTPDHAPIVKLTQLREGKDLVALTVIATTNQVYIVADADPTHILASYHHENNNQYNIIAIYHESAREYIFDFAPIRSPIAASHAAGPRVAAYVNSGNTLDRVIRLPEDSYENDSQPSTAEKLTPIVAPPLGVVALGTLEWFFPDPPGRDKLFSLFLGFFNYSLFGAIPTAIALLTLTRRYQFPRRIQILWSTLALLLGPTAMLLLFCMRPRPYRIP